MSQITEYVADETVHKHPFTIVYNELIDSKLPLDVIGMLVYMCRQLPGWVFHEHILLERFQCGREKLQKMRRLAREAGFMKLEKIPSGKGDGKFKGSRYLFSSRPIYLNRETEKPTPGENRLPVKPSLFNKTKNIINTKRKDKENIKRKAESLPAVAGVGEGELDNGFDLFWKTYPVKKGGKEVARKSFNKALKSVPLARMLRSIEEQAQERAHKARVGAFVPEWPYPSTWLNKGRWDDSVQSQEQIERMAPKGRTKAQDREDASKVRQALMDKINNRVPHLA